MTLSVQNFHNKYVSFITKNAMTTDHSDGRLRAVSWFAQIRLVQPSFVSLNVDARRRLYSSDDRVLNRLCGLMPPVACTWTLQVPNHTRTIPVVCLLRLLPNDWEKNIPHFVYEPNVCTTNFTIKHMNENKLSNFLYEFKLQRIQLSRKIWYIN